MTVDRDQVLASLAESDRRRGDHHLLHALRGVEEDALREALHSMQEAWFLISQGGMSDALAAIAVLEQGIASARDALGEEPSA